MGHAGADRLDHAGALHAQRQRQRIGVQAGALVDVDEVDADGMVADAHLAGAGLADLQLDELHRFGAAELADLDRAGCGHSCLL